MYLKVLNKTEQKKSFFLLVCSIFFYHDMEEHEEKLMLDYANLFDAKQELDWACEFVKKDILTAFERSRKLVHNLLEKEDIHTQIDILTRVWEVNKDKGYINEKEANLLLGLARDFNIESDFIEMVKTN